MEITIAGTREELLEALQAWKRNVPEHDHAQSRRRAMIETMSALVYSRAGEALFLLEARDDEMGGAANLQLRKIDRADEFREKLR